MSLLKDAAISDSGLAVAAKYLINVTGPFFEMPLTGDTDKVRNFQLARRIGELEALIYRVTPSPSNLHRMRFLLEQLLAFALESGVPLGDDDAYSRWVMRNGTLEDMVMHTAFEIDRFLDTAFNAPIQVQQLPVIRKNLLVNFTILEELQETMMSGGPGSQEELEAFELAVNSNLEKARNILDSFDYF